MDERRLEELLRDAAAEPPEASFTVDDVTAASRRTTARRRSVLAAVAAVVVLGGGAAGVVATVGGSGPEQPVLAEAPMPDGTKKSGPTGQPGEDHEREQGAQGDPGVQSFPDVSPKQGGETSGKNGPQADGTSACTTVDREVATALAGELPIDPVGEAVPAPSCPHGVRAAAYHVPGGTVAVFYDPARSVRFPATSGSGRTATASAPVPGGAGEVGVLSYASRESGAVPLADRLEDIADGIVTAMRG